MRGGTRFNPLNRDKTEIVCTACYDGQTCPDTIHLYALKRTKENAISNTGKQLTDDSRLAENRNHISIPLKSLDGNDKSKARKELHMNRNDAMMLYKALAHRLGIEQ